MTYKMYFYAGPQGYFYADSLKSGENILNLMDVDNDEWTATEVVMPTRPLAKESP